ncbi:MAG: hypothetical protein AB1446_00630 [Bacillota bacterium]
MPRDTPVVRWGWEQGLPVPLGIVRANGFLPVVEVLDRWVEAGKWWEGEEEETIFFRIHLADGSVREVRRRLGGAAEGERDKQCWWEIKSS